LRQLLGYKPGQLIHCPQIFKSVLFLLQKQNANRLFSQVAYDFLTSNIEGGDFVLYTLVLQGLNAHPQGYAASDVMRIFKVVHEQPKRRIVRISTRFYSLVFEMLKELGEVETVAAVCDSILTLHEEAKEVLSPSLTVKMLHHLARRPTIASLTRLYLFCRNSRVSIAPSLYVTMLSTYIEVSRFRLLKEGVPLEPLTVEGLKTLTSDVATQSHLLQNNVLRNLLISAYCVLGDRERAEQLFYDNRKEPASDHVLECHFIEGAGLLRDLDLLKRLRTEIFSQDSVCSSPAALLTFHNLFLYQAATVVNTDLMESWLQDGLHRGIASNPATYHALLSGYFFADNHPKFVSTFFEFQRTLSEPCQHSGINKKLVIQALKHYDFGFLLRALPHIAVGRKHLNQIIRCACSEELGSKDLEIRVQLLTFILNDPYYKCIQSPKNQEVLDSFRSRHPVLDLPSIVTHSPSISPAV